MRSHAGFPRKRPAPIVQPAGGANVAHWLSGKTRSVTRHLRGSPTVTRGDEAGKERVTRASPRRSRGCAQAPPRRPVTGVLHAVDDPRPGELRREGTHTPFGALTWTSGVQ